MKIINPATEEEIANLDEDTPASLDARFRLLRSAQPAWARKGPDERIAALKRFGQLLETQLEPLAATLTAETGKPLQQARNEIKGAITRTDWLTSNAMQYLREEYMTEAGNLR
ncbi:MAG TPA: aldehyde dehydrogenase family protein, partial [Anseongella sp.]|nr:aldehyde dehydrogenase family protein [Anseongella sp.]